MVKIGVKCIWCGSENVFRHGKTKAGIQVYICRNKECKKSRFQLEYKNKGCYPKATEKIIKMTVNGSGIRDIERVTGINHGTIIDRLKKRKI